MLKFVQDSSTTTLFQAYLNMLMEYFQRRSGLNDFAFNNIVEQSKIDFDMVKEVGGWKLTLKKAEEKGITKSIVGLIQSKRFTDIEIVDFVNEQVAFVSGIRKIIDLISQPFVLNDEQIAEKSKQLHEFVQNIRAEIDALKSQNKFF